MLLECKRDLLLHFNCVLGTGNISPLWKLAWVAPLLKPSKNQADIASYRPVSLTSCVAKLMENLVNSRLMWWLESKRKLPACMTGFRQRLCAQDSVLDLVSHVEHQRSYRLSTLALFLTCPKPTTMSYKAASSQSCHKWA